VFKVKSEGKLKVQNLLCRINAQTGNDAYAIGMQYSTFYATKDKLKQLLKLSHGC
jgi:hypothetical protein